jgi:two-component system invasion response regulator UvrY
MIRVFVADDHCVVREGVKQVLSSTPDLRVAGEASNGREACSLIFEQGSDVLVLDPDMPDKNGLEILHDLKHMCPQLPVLVFGVYTGGPYAMRAIKAGAAGYLSKDSLPQDLVTAIRKVVHGGRYVSPCLAEELVFEMSRDSDQPLHSDLSDREYQVLCLFADGKTASEIAQELSLSVKTISTYRSRILEKLNLKTTADLIRYAIHQQLVD